MTSPSAASPTPAIEGLVEQRNEHGIKVGGTWCNRSRFRPLELPDRGARVRLVVDGKGFITTLEQLEAPRVSRETPRARLAVLTAAAAFAASRAEIRSADVLAIAERWLEWVDADV